MTTSGIFADDQIVIEIDGSSGTFPSVASSNEIDQWLEKLQVKRSSQLKIQLSRPWPSDDEDGDVLKKKR